MELALYNPAFGFYTNESSRGAGVDFATAPETSPLFGYFVAKHALAVWDWKRATSRSKTALQIVEVGGARRTLLSQIASFFGFIPSGEKAYPVAAIVPQLIPAIRSALGIEPPRIPPAVHYCVVDPALRAKTPAEASSGQWIGGWIPISEVDSLASSLQVNAFPTLDEFLQTEYFAAARPSFTLVVANEVFDNVPSHLLLKDGGQIRELLVTTEGDHLVLVAAPGSAPDSLISLAREAHWCRIDDLQPELLDVIHPETYRSLSKEAAIVSVSSQQESLASQICKAAATAKEGCLLIFDLFENPYRSPVVAYTRHHQLLDPFAAPGDIDIMVPVQWNRIAHTLRRHGFKPRPLMRQAEWLEGHRFGEVRDMLAASLSDKGDPRIHPIASIQARSLLVSATALSDPLSFGGFAVLEASGADLS